MPSVVTVSGMAGRVQITTAVGVEPILIAQRLTQLGLAVDVEVGKLVVPESLANAVERLLPALAAPEPPQPPKARKSSAMGGPCPVCGFGRLDENARCGACYWHAD